MTARVLVVDDIFANVKLLEAKLTAEYFDVVTAMNGADALAICDQGLCDIVLLDVMMPGMDGFEVCRRLKNSPATAHLPVVMVTALDQPSDRLKGLDAGADDFLTKPVDDTALFARVRSLVRLKAVTDELRTRALTSREYGLIGDPLVLATAETGLDSRILLIDDRASSYERLNASLSQYHQVTVESDAAQALARAEEENFDIAIVSLDLEGVDGLRVCSQLRSVERTRNMAVLMLAEADDRSRILRGLEIGVNDFLTRPVDRNELLARVRSQARRKRFSDRLRDAVQESMEMAVTDALTGLHNRRYLDTQLAALFDESLRRGKHLSVLVMDIDKFKPINDTYGHDAGDEVLREFAKRVRSQTRGIDIVARFGGEEIVVVIPDTGIEIAEVVAERIRRSVHDDRFAIHQEARQIPVTVSIGVASRQPGDTSAQDMLKRADLALYRAKNQGRNQVVSTAA
ncbi:MAG: PleD family two-component system response regulator [Salinarimonas sp.]